MEKNNNDAYKALLIETSAKDAHTNLISFLTLSNIFSACYAYKSRVKPRSKLIEKKERKLAEKPGYSLESICDVVGLRLVTLFRRDMPDVVRRIAHIISHGDGVDLKNPFIKSTFDEVVIYSVNPTYDEIIHEVKESLKEYGILDTSIKVEHSKEGYSSIHLVSKLNYAINDEGNSDLTNYNVPVEIQIRTVFEDAWGEIDHKYGYVIRAGKDIGYPISNPEFVLKHLKVLKRFSDACAEYADIIFLEANPTPNNIAPVGAVISVAADDLLIQRFRDTGVPIDQIDTYLAARDIKNEAQQLLATARDLGVNKYMQAAEAFRGILPEECCLPPQRDQLGAYLFYYYVRMNEAVCLLSTNQVDGIKAANTIYMHLGEAYENFPLLKLRIGQTLGKLGNIDQAIHNFRLASQLAQEHLDKNNGAFDDVLPKADYNHIESAIPILLGYHLWKKFTSLPDSNKGENLSILKEAIELTTHLAKTSAEERHKRLALNNVVYYLVEYLQNTANAGLPIDTSDLSTLAKHVQTLEKTTDLTEVVDIEVLDTFAHAFAYLGNKERAISVCSRIEELALQNMEVPKVTRDLKMELITSAFNIRKKFENG